MGLPCYRFVGWWGHDQVSTPLIKQQFFLHHGVEHWVCGKFCDQTDWVAIVILSDRWQYSLSEIYREVQICPWEDYGWPCFKKKPEKFQTNVNGVHLISTFVIETDACRRWQTTILHCTGKVEGAGLLGRNLHVLQKTLSYHCVPPTCRF